MYSILLNRLNSALIFYKNLRKFLRPVRPYYDAIKFVSIFALTLIPAVFLRFFKIRFLRVNVSRIGHLVCDLTAYFKINSNTDLKYYVLAPKSKVANYAVLRYLPNEIHFITNEILCALLRPILVNPVLTIDLNMYSESYDECYVVLAEKISCNKKILFLNKHDENIAKNSFESLGLKSNSWFVCIHSRESGYSGEHDYGQAYRNSNILDYRIAVDHIVAMGGVAVRMGDSTMRPWDFPGKVLDYANSSIRNDSVDIALCAKTRLFLGNTSGITSLAYLFGVPVCLANMIPLSHTFPPIGQGNIGIPKLILNENGEYISFGRMFELGISNLRSDSAWSEFPFHIKNNSPEDIGDLLIEGIYQLDGIFQESSEDRYLQKCVKNLFLKKSHYHFNDKSIIGRLFLRKYKEFLL